MFKIVETFNGKNDTIHALYIFNISIVAYKEYLGP
jgi:hypothetical protein